MFILGSDYVNYFTDKVGTKQSTTTAEKSGQRAGAKLVGKQIEIDMKVSKDDLKEGPVEFREDSKPQAVASDLSLSPPPSPRQSRSRWVATCMINIFAQRMHASL